MSPVTRSPTTVRTDPRRGVGGPSNIRRPQHSHTGSLRSRRGILTKQRRLGVISLEWPLSEDVDDRPVAVPLFTTSVWVAPPLYSAGIQNCHRPRLRPRGSGMQESRTPLRDSVLFQEGGFLERPLYLSALPCTQPPRRCFVPVSRYTKLCSLSFYWVL